jgi:hypothetical protein
MSDELQNAIEAIQSKIKTHLDEVVELKRAANAICRITNKEPLYPDADADHGGIGPTRADAYYGKQFSTAAREYLDFRKRACSAEEILNGLEKGGFDFDALGWKGEHRLRSVAVSLAKNTAMFRRLPNGTFGLNAWYQDAPVPKRRGKSKSDTSPEAQAPPPVESDALPLDQESTQESTVESDETANETETGSEAG